MSPSFSFTSDIIASVKDKKIIIQINKPASEVFAFTTDPKNTPLWIDSIEHEEINEWPAKLGTVYRNRGAGSDGQNTE